MSITSLKTISTKDLGYSAKEVRKLVDGKGSAKVFIARIGGIVNEVIRGDGKNGEWVGFKGKFFAVTEKGDRFTSEVAFLPANLTKKLVDGWGEGVLQIDLPPVDVFAVESDKSGVGYAYLSDFMLDDAAIRKSEAIANNIFSTKLPTNVLIEAPKKAKSA